MSVPVDKIQLTYEVGLELMNLSEYEYAKKVFEEALSLQPDDREKYTNEHIEGSIHYSLGYAVLECGDKQAAEQHWLQSIALFPGNFFAYDALIKLYKNDFSKRFRLRVRSLSNALPIFKTRLQWNLRVADAIENKKEGRSIAKIPCTPEEREEIEALLERLDS